jgi:predicted glutamine amidotransferase
MCGLVGIYSSNMLAKHKDVLAAMLYLDTWRGRDSTGVAAIRHNTDTAVLKATIPGYEFVEGPKLDQHLKLNDFLWLGHNRFGTVGKNVKTNSHPFMIDDDDGACLVVGAHNGTLKNKHVLIDHARFGTDSEALYNNIAVEGLEKTIEKVEGAWALTYYDHLEEELRVLRNKERPLFYAFEEGKKTLVWASEMWMIRVACSRYDLQLQDDKVFSFAEDTLYRFPAPMNMNEEIVMERKGGVVGKQTPTFFQSWNREVWTGGGHTQGAAKAAGSSTGSSTSSSAIAAVSSTPYGTNGPSNGGKLAETSASSSTGTSSEQPDGKVRDILSAKKYKGYAGVLLTAKELEKKLETGCGWCELEFITEKDRFAWLAPSKPICYKCLTGEPEPDKKVQVVCH